MDHKTTTYAPRTRHWHKLLLCVGLVAALGVEECEFDLGFVSIESPQAKTFTEAQTVTITATAVSGEGLTVVGIDFYRNGRKMGTDATPPYTHLWNITAADNDQGPHRWHAEAVYQVGSTGEERLKSDEVVYEVAIASAPTNTGVIGYVSDSTDFANGGIAVSGTLSVVTGAGDGTWFKTIDVSNPSEPRVLGSLRAPVGNGGDVAFDGSFAYSLLITSQGVELVVVDARRPADPALAARLRLPGNPISTGLDVDGSTAFVAATDAGLQIVDISDPFAPRIIGTVGIDGKPQDVAVIQGYAYVAAKWNIATVDVRNPSRPVVVAAQRTSNALLATADGTKLIVFGTGRFIIWDASSPEDLRGLSATTHLDTRNMHIRGNILSIATDSFDRDRNGVHVYDISNPLEPRLVNHIVTPGGVRSLATSNDRLFAGDNESILDVIALDF